MNEAKARAEMEAIWHPEGIWAAFVQLGFVEAPGLMCPPDEPRWAMGTVLFTRAICRFST